MSFRIYPLVDLKRQSVEDLKRHKDEAWEYYKIVKRVLQYKEIEE